MRPTGIRLRNTGEKFAVISDAIGPGAHQRHHRLAAEKRAGEIGTQHVLPQGFIDPVERALRIDARHVDQNVDAAVLLRAVHRVPIVAALVMSVVTATAWVS